MCTQLLTRKHMIMMLTSTLFIFFIGTVGVTIFYGYGSATGSQIVRDIQQLKTIFQQIHRECRILSFDYQTNPINFLTVKSFVGSEVGSMNLGNPEKWAGPYVKDNLNVQATDYMIVQVKDGYFITPGNGVKLPNGKRIGIEIMLDENADIISMMQKNGPLNYKGDPLAVALNLQQPLTPLEEN